MSERIMEGPIEKKIMGRNGCGRWELRRALFTASMFVLTKAEQDIILVSPPLLPALLAPPTDSHAYAQDCIPLRDIEYVVLVSQAPVQMIQSPLGETAADLAGGSEGHTAQQPEQLKRGNSSVPEERESAGSLPRAGSAKPRLRQMSQETSRAARASARAAPELPSGEVARSFNIVTSENGYNGGRIYSLRVETEDECKEWVEKLRAAVKSDKRAAESTAMGTGLPRLRRQARLWYNSTLSQVCV